MVLDGLSDSISNAIKKVLKAPVVDEKVVKELVRDIQRALLQSDVNVKLCTPRWRTTRSCAAST